MSDAEREFLMALAGNPNCGKTTLFNAVTGARQHVGNYPGITVEKKEGFHTLNGTRIRLVDLPGTYSLTAYSMEELVARDFLVNDRPRVVIDIVDASNLERNLYLTVQLLELGTPLVIALNMMDAAAARGIEIDAAELARRLRLPVIPTVARTGKGKDELLAAAVGEATKDRAWEPLHVSYGPDVDPALREMEKNIRDAGFLTDVFPARWTALKVLEGDEQVLGKGREADPELSRKLEATAARVAEHLEKTLDSYPEAIIADHRYGFIASLLRNGVVRQNRKADRLYLSDQLDRVLTNRFLGPIIMMAILYAVYQFTFNYSRLPVELLESGFNILGRYTESTLPDGPVKSLVVSGIIDGVGGIIGFVPLIVFMFLSIALLEDTGYLARVAYMLDRVFRSFGLHGSSVMAFIISGGIAGGCAVPGVMATRTLRSSKERLATLLTAPFMNCGAKLPVFAMLIAAFFPERRAVMMFVLTLLSWSAALLLAKLIRVTILRGPSTPFLLELPPYRLPTFKGLLIHTWERTWQYIRKAGTIILAISILFWALMSFPGLSETQRQAFDAKRQDVLRQIPEDVKPEVPGRGQDAGTASAAAWRDRLLAVDREEAESALKHSFAGRIGTALEGITRWTGFDWRLNVALLSGFAAKELIISTLGTAYSLGESGKDEELSLSARLAADKSWNPLQAFAVIVFIMLYAPCLATVTCIIKESGTWKWGVFSMAFNTAIAFALAILVYQGGLWLGMGT
ncbi:ferrous iron transport protein B [Syntrophobacter fumaroxidans]|uniref:Ferrous iron transport protein B n=1 Tax=Syntrophobacter fumaroxidans (strain DSM 10017 / MPOB) TaxID=335543 RepID=A0LL70_SYNFM|nr:ferrous iron transport protein B [Syntrophobacter fumaroxidans]ABK18172.1 ferrous iron transport protein B [Syntrophobacter fumaroxidans MPOB]